MSPIPRLSYDVLYLISEKLLFKKKSNYKEVDLTLLNGYTLFMNHSVKNMQSFVSNFSKMEKLMLEDRIYFYNELDIADSNYVHYFVYYVPKSFVLELFDAGLLRISYLYIASFLPKNKEILDHLSKSIQLYPNLNILNLFADESSKIIKKYLITLFSINAEELQLDCHDQFFIGDPTVFENVLPKNLSFERTKIIATRLTMHMVYISNFLDNFKNYLNLLLICFPKLEIIEICFKNNSIINYFEYNGLQSINSTLNISSSHLLSLENFAINLEIFINSISEHLKSLNNGSKNLRILVQFNAIFGKHWFQDRTRHNLYTFGKPYVVYIGITNFTDCTNCKPPFIARYIEVNDLVKRQHICLFKICNLY